MTLGCCKAMTGKQASGGHTGSDALFVQPALTWADDAGLEQVDLARPYI